MTQYKKSSASSDVFDNLDLVRLIYSFGDSRHREYTRQLYTEICDRKNHRKKQKKIHYNLNHVFMGSKIIWDYVTSLQNGGQIGYYKYLEEVATINDITKQLTILNRCDCCKGHNTKKPMVVDGKIVYRNAEISHNYTILIENDYMQYLTLDQVFDAIMNREAIINGKQVGICNCKCKDNAGLLARTLLSRI